MTQTLERTTIEILEEKYPEAKREIISNHFELTEAEYQEHARYLVLSLDDALFALYTNTTQAESFTEAFDLVATMCGGVSMGSADDVALATRFWLAGRDG
jgi:hypothetical protein